MVPTVCCSCSHRREGDGGGKGKVGRSRLPEMHGFLRGYGENELMCSFMLVFTWKDQ